MSKARLQGVGGFEVDGEEAGKGEGAKHQDD